MADYIELTSANNEALVISGLHVYMLLCEENGKTKQDLSIMQIIQKTDNLTIYIEEERERLQRDTESLLFFRNQRSLLFSEWEIVPK